MWKCASRHLEAGQHLPGGRREGMGGAGRELEHVRKRHLRKACTLKLTNPGLARARPKRACLQVAVEAGQHVR